VNQQTGSRSTTPAKNSQDAKVKEMVADINHAVFPIGPVGVPTEYPPVLQPAGHEVHEVSEGGEGIPALS